MKYHPAYEAVRNYYGQARAARSQIPLINHIDQGITILATLRATSQAVQAYCLHPLFQSDNNLAAFRHKLAEFDPYVIALVMEYRHIANNHLSNSQNTDITLSPLKEVNDMLRADKVQNYKDFLLYNKNHPNADRLDKYFKRWLKALSITDEQFNTYVSLLTQNDRILQETPA